MIRQALESDIPEPVDEETSHQNRLRPRVVEKPVSNTFFRSATTLTPNNPWLKRVTKILRHLRDDLARLHPSETMPSTWMIKCLLASTPKMEFNKQEVNQLTIGDEQWDKSLLDIIRNLETRTQLKENRQQTFFELDGKTPLFPNEDVFTLDQANRFFCLALEYLGNNTSANP